jgi:pimeloyl-ACP methyl ester carboxylesterase
LQGDHNLVPALPNPTPHGVVPDHVDETGLRPLVALDPGVTAAPRGIDPVTTRASGLRLGAYAVGFEVRHTSDPTRRINSSGEGTAIGLATWYPARPTPASGPPVTTLDYRLLDVRKPRTASEAAALEEAEIDTLVAWRHVGVVALTRDQARASLQTGGVARRGAPPVDRRFPVVLVLGGPYYLSTTAELLASHGFLVVAPFRVQDQSNEIGALGFTWYLENSVRDAEWALEELRRHPQADTRFVSTIGHGGGGMLAMLLAMRSRDVDATVNIDAGNFSSRSQPRSVPFYSPRAMRAPYLFIATAETRRGQDLFDDFVDMTFADRFEVVLETPHVRHHDLSDVGRAVTAPLGIRGDHMAAVQASYVAVHEMTVRFLLAEAGGRETREAYRHWLAAQKSAGALEVAIRPGTEPAPTIARALETLDASTASMLVAARQRDPDAPLFQADQLARLVDKAIAVRDFETADALSALAAEWRPEPLLAELRSRALEGRGDVARAIDAARACADMPAGTHWRALGAVDRCRQRLTRLTAAPGGRR